MNLRVVFDTNIVLSALLFTSGQLTWLRTAWEKHALIPIVTTKTVEELLRVLSYPKFQLSKEERNDVLADYLPFSETFVLDKKQNDALPLCRDADDQIFLNLAYQSKVKYLVTGDKDLLKLNESVRFDIVTALRFRQIFTHND